MRIAPTPRRRRFVVAILILTGALLCAGVAGAFLKHKRVSRGNHLAVRYGLASSSGNVSLQARCVARALDGYNHSTDPGKAGIPPQAFRFLAPRACALAIRRGLVRSDGELSANGNSGQLLAEAGNQFGKERMQKMVFTELAVSPYHLARSNSEVTRWDRCLAMGFSGYDAQQQRVKEGLPSRALFMRAVRQACTIGVRRGLIPESGAPSVDVLRSLMAQAIKAVSNG
jgi:hypothetical protein